MRVCALTTVDNPYDYFENQDEWEAYEVSHGQRCYNQLGRFCFTSTSLSNEEYANEVERAIDEIVKYDLTNTFVKVMKKE